MERFRLKDGIIEYKGSRYLSSVILIRKGKNILIDPGRKCFLKEKIDEIWLTHIHPDHFFYLKYFPRVPVFIHPEGLNYMISEDPYRNIILREINEVDRISKNIIGLKKIMIIFISRFFLLLFGFPFYRKERFNNKFIPFKDGEERYGIRIFFSPGHSPDCLSFFIEKERILISGDLIVKRKPFSANLLLPLSSVEDSLNSFKLLKKLNPEIILPGHGKPIYNAMKKINESIFLTEKEIDCVKRNWKRNFYLTYFSIQRCLKNKSIMARLSSIVIYSKLIYRK